jgi:hypothetical protein
LSILGNFPGWPRERSLKEGLLVSAHGVVAIGPPSLAENSL